MAPELLGGDDDDGGRRGSVAEGEKPQLPTGKHAHMLASKIDVYVGRGIGNTRTHRLLA